MAVTKSRHDPWQLFGLSTDTKWTDSEMPVGSRFHATDTDADYIWSGTAWETITAGAVSISATAEVTGTITISSGSITVVGATAAVISNTSITAGNTNYSAVITSSATRFGISLQTGASTAYFRIAFATSSATTGGTALQVKGDGEYFEEGIRLTADTTIYVTVSTAPQTVQIIAWK
jgi:hypothetical protein